MFRFVIPEPALPRAEQLRLLHAQFEAFLNSDALRELFELLEVDRSTFSRVYNGRLLSDGRILETQDLEPVKALERHRGNIYPLLEELGFLSINRPLEEDHSHLVVLGGSLEACHTRAEAAAARTMPSVRSIDGLACFRPVHPKERSVWPGSFACETEFGAMTESFLSAFSLPPVWADDFHGDRNLNRISCVRLFSGARDGRRYRVFATPSALPEQRRADTGDSFLFYLQRTEFRDSDSLLVLTNNRYCNRQFLQLAFLMMHQDRPVRFDIIGCTPDERIVSCDRYEPFQFLQDLIGVLDWIERFEREFLL